MDTKIKEQIKNKTSEILRALGVDFSIEESPYATSADDVSFNIVTADAGILIGERGQNLLALEHVVKRIIRKEKGELVARFSLDVNGYRAHQVEELKEAARGFAKKVRLYRKEIRLDPMTSYERRIIHIVLAEYPDIVTESVGRDPYRAIVIRPNP
ncbi:hypothetical protein KGQ34_02390 [Patescibacteria group bacterium]|nr:hypothetical protein [Patescibacteria group bacterium]